MDLGGAIDEAASREVSRGPQCSVGQLLQVVSPEDCEKLRKVIDYPLPSGRWLEGTTIASVLVDQGFSYITSHMVQRHRRRVRGGGAGCKCPI